MAECRPGWQARDCRLLRQQTLGAGHADGAALEQATTSSLRALQLFSQGRQFHERGETAAAEAAFRQAIAKDPDFASAHLSLAYALRALERPPEEYRTHARRAVQLLDLVSEVERHYIQGGYHVLSGELERVVDPLQMVLRLHPDHYPALITLRWVYWNLARSAEAAELSARLAGLRPASFKANAQAASGLLMHGQAARSQVYFDRARVLDSSDARARALATASLFDMYPVRRHLAAGEVEQALEVLHGLPPYPLVNQPAPAKNGYLSAIFYTYLELGRLQDAERILDAMDIVEPDARRWRNRLLALVSQRRDDLDRSREYAQQIGPWPWGVRRYQVTDIEMLVRADLLERAREAVDEMGKESEFFAGESIISRALLDLGAERFEQAEAGFRQALAFTNHPPLRLFASYHLADLMLHRLSQADDDHALVRELRAIRSTHTRASVGKDMPLTD